MLQIADQRALALTPLPRPIVDVDDRCCCLRPSGPPAQGAQQRVAADRQQQPGRKAGAGSAEGQTKVMRRRSNLDVRRAKRAAMSGREALGEDPRRAGSHRAAEPPDHDGRSAADDPSTADP
jgi:hypothetical protein